MNQPHESRWERVFLGEDSYTSIEFWEILEEMKDAKEKSAIDEFKH